MSELLTLLMILWFGRELCLAFFPRVVDAMMVRVEDRAVSFLEGLGYRVLGPDQVAEVDETARDLEKALAGERAWCGELSRAFVRDAKTLADLREQVLEKDKERQDLEAKVARLEMSLEDRYGEVKSLIRERDDLSTKAKQLEYALRDEREEVKEFRRRCDLLNNEVLRLLDYNNEA